MRDRLALVVSIAVLLAPLSAEAAKARAIRRDFPQNSRCPVHTDAASNDDPLVFTPSSDKATLTFVTCDDRSSGFFSGDVVDVSIDDLMVIRQDVFNKSTNRIPWDANIPASYGLTDLNCYFDADQGDFDDIGRVQSVFKRDTAGLGTTRIPFKDNFEGSTKKWVLGNASVGDPENDSNHELLLARSDRNNDSIVDGNLCSMARLKVSGLAAGSRYVIDFVWRVTWAFGPSADDPEPVLTVFIED